MIIPVTDPDDPRIAAYRDVRERDLVGREGAFMAEGEVILRLLASRPDPGLASALLSERAAERLGAVAQQLARAIPVYVAAQAVMDEVAGFPIHRGILALGRPRPPRDPAALLACLPPRALAVGVVGVTNHDNMGGIFRNAAAFGAACVLIDLASCNPLYRKAIRVSVGASLIVPFARVADGAAMLELFARHAFTVIALSPSGRETLAQVARPQRVAALFGTEGPGLPADVLAGTRSVSIPMAEGFDSLNVATTSGIVLYHLARAAG